MNTAVLDFQDSQSVSLRPSVGVKAGVSTACKSASNHPVSVVAYQKAQKKIDWSKRAGELHNAFGDAKKPEHSGSFGGFLL